MASSSGKPLGDPTLTAKHPPRLSLLLKDYLRDDLSSCSSSGFKSFPRRQCCIRPRSSSSSSSSTMSALQKASEAVLNAIKSLAIPARQRSPALSERQRSQGKKGGGVLSGSLSRKLLSRRFGRTLGDKPAFSSTASSASASNSYSWAETHSRCSLTAAEDSTEVEGSVTTNNCSITSSTRDWPNEEKEQFSPVSVLDCPLFADDEEITSPFNSTTCSRLEGTKHRHMQKSRHFDRVASLKPVALEKRIASSEMEDVLTYNHPTNPCSVSEPIMCSQNGVSNVLGDNVEENARDLLNHVKRSINKSLIIEAENLLFDFFKQSIGENNDTENSKKHHLCKVAEDWIRGQPQELCLGWQVREGRQVCIREMDKCCGDWRNSDGEIQQLALELEVEFSASLVNELVLDLTTC